MNGIKNSIEEYLFDDSHLPKNVILKDPLLPVKIIDREKIPLKKQGNEVVKSVSKTVTFHETIIDQGQKISVNMGNDSGNVSISIKLPFEEKLFSSKTFDQQSRIQSVLEFQLNQTEFNRDPEINKASMTAIVNSMRGMTKEKLQDFLTNPDNGMKFRYSKEMSKKDWDYLYGIIPDDGWCGYRITAHMIMTLSTLEDGENPYEAVINKLDDCSLGLRYLFNKNVCNNNTFHSFWFEVINVMKQMINNNDKSMIRAALDMVQDNYGGFENDDQRVEYFFDSLVKVTEKLKILFETEVINGILDGDAYMDVIEIQCLQLAIRNMEKYQSAHKIQFYFFGGNERLLIEDKKTNRAYLFTTSNNEMHLFSELLQMTPETFVLSTGVHFSVLWDPSSFIKNMQCTNDKHKKAHTYNCTNSTMITESLLLESLLDKILDQIICYDKKTENIKDVENHVADDNCSGTKLFDQMKSYNNKTENFKDAGYHVADDICSENDVYKKICNPNLRFINQNSNGRLIKNSLSNSFDDDEDFFGHYKDDFEYIDQIEIDHMSKDSSLLAARECKVHYDTGFINEISETNSGNYKASVKFTVTGDYISFCAKTSDGVNRIISCLELQLDRNKEINNCPDNFLISLKEIVKKD